MYVCTQLLMYAACINAYVASYTNQCFKFYQIVLHSCTCTQLHIRTFSITDTLAIIIIIIVDTITTTTIIIHSTTLTVTRWTLVVLQYSIDRPIIYMMCPVTLLYKIHSVLIYVQPYVYIEWELNAYSQAYIQHFRDENI